MEMIKLNYSIENENLEYTAYHQSIENRKNCAVFDELAKEHVLLSKQYENAFNELNEAAEKNTFRHEYSKNQNFGLPRGYYSPSRADWVVGGADRGRLLKSAPKKIDCNYEYCFDAENRLICVKELDFFKEQIRHLATEFIFHEQDREFSLVFELNFILPTQLSYIRECKYENGLLMQFAQTSLKYGDAKKPYWRIEAETFAYTDGLLSEMHRYSYFPPLQLSHYKFKFNQDDEGYLSTYKCEQMGYKPKGRREYEEKSVFQVSGKHK
ncbi:MAG: hypothetical protein E7616_07195 [Ruminococcaceae bacterium]|nr:hypothetical protein [Oscillospiraceae bacterium]